MRFVILGRLLLAASATFVTLTGAEWGVRRMGLGKVDSAFMDHVAYAQVLGKADLTEDPKILREGMWFRRPIDAGKGLTAPANRFEMPKPEGTYRIFVFGESTTLGCPISITGGPQNEISFPAWLGLRLRKRYPGVLVEVLNVGHGGQNLETAWRYAIECLEFEPDAFVFYSGHNEFLPHSILAARTRMHPYAVPPASTPMLTHLGRLWQQFLSSLEEHRDPDIGTLDFPLPERMIGRCYHTEDDAASIEYSDRRLLMDLARHCQSHGVELFLCTLINNLSDFEPSFSYIDSVEDDSRTLAWEREIARARTALEEGRPQETLQILDALPAPAQDLAEVWFRRGKAFEALNRRADALDCYINAKDKDGIQRRAPTAVNDVIRAICRESSARLVDVELESFKARQDRPPGNDCFFDNCHPTFEGTLLIVEALEKAIVLSRCIRGQSAAAQEHPPSFEVELKEIGFQPVLLGVMYAAVGQSYGGLVLGRRYDPGERLRVARELFLKVPEKFPYYRQCQMTLGCVEIIAGETDRARQRFAEHHIPDEELKSYVQEFVRRARSRGIEKAFVEAGILAAGS